MSNLDRYRVELVAVDDIKPSPENDAIYGTIDDKDEKMADLVDSIRRHGLAEPILLSADGFILSGHRRFYACKQLGMTKLPCRYLEIARHGSDDYHRTLAEFNPQRIKSIGAQLRESLLLDDSATDTYASIQNYHAASMEVDVEYMKVAGEKLIKDISEGRREFLAAAVKVVNDLKKYWPLSVRTIHYNLLNKPPRKFVPKKKVAADYRLYVNDKHSYGSLTDLLRDARYLGYIPMYAIDDPTRPQIYRPGFRNVTEFVNQQLAGFLTGYHRDRQMDQPRHIEILGEKNTLISMLKPTALEYYTPLSLARGFCSTPVFRDMSRRFEKSGKSEMTLVIVSDYDPEGWELADDAIRTLRDLWDLPVQGHRVAVTRDQIDEMDLAEDFNPAKATSSRYKSFLKRTGGDTRTWECEALPPDFLVEQVRAAIEGNMDMALFQAVIEQEEQDAEELFRVKREIAGQMRL